MQPAPPIGALRGWLPLLVLPALVVGAFPAGAPRWQFMWLLSVAIYTGCKWLTWRRTPRPGAPWWQHAGYLLAWPGMDAGAFLAPASRSRVAPPPASEWLLASAKLLLGVGIFWGAQFALADWPLPLGWAGMTGLVMMLHFGSFHLLSCAWRAGGVDAAPLMDWPFRSTRLAEFWGQRWNRAFRDLTFRFLFRPLSRRFGAMVGLIAGFFASGVVHDVVISLPAGGGGGWPTVFFVVQAVVIGVERSPVGRGIGLGRGFTGWLWTTGVLALPLCGLFHEPFVREIILPFMAVLGAA